MANGARGVVSQDPLAAATADELRVLREVLAAIRAVQHGTVSLILQDRRVVQIDRTEKRRLVS
jgi:hypothetical protein